jgi:two-component system LytT family sensor kinase
MHTKLNKTDYLLLGLFYSITSLIQIRDYVLSENTLLEYVIDIPVSVIVSLCLVFIFGFWLIPKYAISSKRYLLFTFIGIFFLCFFGGIEFIAGYWSGNNTWDKLPSFNNLIFKFLDYGAESLSFPLGLLLTKKFYEGKTELISVEKEKKENELKLLRSQIDPHFLFNNLNTLDSLIDSDPSKAKEYTNKLSLIYRYLIQTKDAEVMELSDEIEFAENYIFLMKTRFGSDYEFSIEKNISLNDQFIPTSALQILLENIVKHNKSDGINVIKTTILINEGWLIITNTKSTLKSKEESFGTGLDNLRARYKLLSDEKIQVHDMEKKFEVFIPIIRLTK